MNNRTAAIILAAGKGKRMNSDLPKVLHTINGKALVRYLVETVTGEPFEKVIVVVGYKGELVIQELKHFNVEFVWQKEQNGTGHAAMMTEAHLKDFDGSILVTNGDVPFIRADSIRGLLASHHSSGAAATCLTAIFDDPANYGRIVRSGDSDVLADIVEEKDASSDIRKITEINTGTFCFNCRDLYSALHRLDDKNAQKELYLTDTIRILARQGKICRVWRLADPLEGTGVNSLDELEALEKAMALKYS